jgi:hypothetical protein
MADQPERTGKSHGALIGQSFLDAFIKTLWDTGLEHLKKRREERTQGKDPRQIFGDAVAKLRIDEKAAYDVIDQFIPLLKPEEQHQFVKNVARVGGPDDVEATIRVLKEFAAFPDDQTRYDRAKQRGYIGDQAKDLHDKALDAATATGSAIIEGAKSAATTVKSEIDSVVQAIDGLTTPAAAEQKTADALTAAKNRFAAMKAKL